MSRHDPMGIDGSGPMHQPFFMQDSAERRHSSLVNDNINPTLSQEAGTSFRDSFRSIIGDDSKTHRTRDQAIFGGSGAVARTSMTDKLRGGSGSGSGSIWAASAHRDDDDPIGIGVGGIHDGPGESLGMGMGMGIPGLGMDDGVAAEGEHVASTMFVDLVNDSDDEGATGEKRLKGGHHRDVEVVELMDG